MLAHQKRVISASHQGLYIMRIANAALAYFD